jgi:hypothetical protein
MVHYFHDVFVPVCRMQQLENRWIDLCEMFYMRMSQKFVGTFQLIKIEHQ